MKAFQEGLLTAADRTPDERGRSNPSAVTTAWYLLGILGFLYLEVFILPRTPVLAYGDQSIYLLNATRMLRGEVIYRDFFQFTAPGTEWTYATLFRCFGVRAWIPQVMLVLIGTVLCWLSVAISRKLARGPLVFLPGLFFVTLAYHNTLDGTHHWYSILALTAALALAIESRTTPRLVAMGVLCGLATWFTQAHGIAGVLGFAFFLWWEERRGVLRRPGLMRAEAQLLGSFIAALVVLNAYFALRAGWHRFLFCTVVFGARYFSADSFNTWRVYMTELPALHGPADLPRCGAFVFIHLITPLVYLLFFVRYRRSAASNPHQPWTELMLVSIFGLFLFASVAPAPGYLGICSISLPALVILVWLLSQPGKLERLILICLCSISAVLLIAEPASRRLHGRACPPAAPRS